MWRNEMEIEDVCRALSRHPRLAAWAAVLSGWVDNVNSHSDGWPYWKAGASAGGKLSDMLARASGVACSREEREAHYRGDHWEPTDAQLRAALSPMKACATRHKMPQPDMPDVVADAEVADLAGQLEVAVLKARRARSAAVTLAAEPKPVNPKPVKAKPVRMQLALFEDAA